MTTIDSLIIGAADPGAAERFYPAAFGPDVDQVVLLLGAEDVGASKKFYVDHGLTVAKGFGKYVEFDAGTGPVTLGLLKRRALAKDAGVPPEGTGSPRLTIVGYAGAITDPDGFAWEARS